jgi:hypothetical protein
LGSVESPLERLSAVDLLIKPIIMFALVVVTNFNWRRRIYPTGAVVQTRSSASQNGDLMF